MLYKITILLLSLVFKNNKKKKSKILPNIFPQTTKDLDFPSTIKSKDRNCFIKGLEEYGPINKIKQKIF